VVVFKKETIYIFVFAAILIFFFIILAFTLHQNITAIFAIIFWVLFIWDLYTWYFPIGMPQLIIDKNGLQYKKNFFGWDEIEAIKLEVNLTQSYLRKEYLNVFLKNENTIDIFIGMKVINKSIEEIAAYINFYKK